MVDLECGWGGWHSRCRAFLDDIDGWTSRRRALELLPWWLRACDIHYPCAHRAYAFVAYDGTIRRRHMVEVGVDVLGLGLCEVQGFDFALEIIVADAFGKLVFHLIPGDDSVCCIWHGLAPVLRGVFGRRGRHLS